jgi:hypothetical protein
VKGGRVKAVDAEFNQIFTYRWARGTVRRCVCACVCVLCVLRRVHRSPLHGEGQESEVPPMIWRANSTHKPMELSPCVRVRAVCACVSRACAQLIALVSWLRRAKAPPTSPTRSTAAGCVELSGACVRACVQARAQLDRLCEGRDRPCRHCESNQISRACGTDPSVRACVRAIMRASARVTLTPLGGEGQRKSPPIEAPIIPTVKLACGIVPGSVCVRVRVCVQACVHLTPFLRWAESEGAVGESPPDLRPSGCVELFRKCACVRVRVSVRVRNPIAAGEGRRVKALMTESPTQIYGQAGVNCS